MPHTFVTGGTGFIGRRLIRALLADGEHVTVLARHPGAAGSLAEAGARVVGGDVTDVPDELARAMRGADRVVHLAARYQLDPPDPETLTRVNVDGTRGVLRAAERAGVEPVVHVSTVVALGPTATGEVADERHDVDGETGLATAYERSKHAAHRIAREAAAAGQDVRVACPGVAYGPGDHSPVASLLKAWVRGLVPAVPFGASTLTFVHVDDVAAGLRAVADTGRPGRLYVLGGEITTLRGFLNEAARVAGRRPPRATLPTALLRWSAPLAGPLLGSLGLSGLGRETVGLLDGRGWAYSSALAESELGYTWRDLAEGLPETVVWAHETPLRPRT